MESLWIKVLGMLIILFVSGKVVSQCSPQSEMYLMMSNTCYGNNTVFNKEDIDSGAESGITCFRNGSSSTAGTLTNQDGESVACDSGVVQCVIGNGSLTFFTRDDFGQMRNGKYTCCIDGSCISARILTDGTYRSCLDSSTPIIENCSITPPLDITAAPQQYIVNMITSKVPPTRLVPEIKFTTSKDCDNQDGISCGTPYYLHLGEEIYQYSLPINWNATNSEFTHHQFKCGAMFKCTQISPLMTTMRAPDGIPTVDYHDINATAIRIFWNILTCFVNGYIITITSSNLIIITHQVNNESVREFVVNGLLRERDYIIEVRGYYDLLGAPGYVTARLQSTIIGINGTLLSVTSNNIQEVQLNCFTSRVKPSEITWSFQAPNNQLEDSELLDETSMTYRHYLQVNGTFNASTKASCIYSVNGYVDSVNYSLQVPSGPPTNVSVKILSSSILSVSWVPPLGVVEGYIIHYSGIDPKLINEDTLNYLIEGLTQGMIYQFSVFAYRDLPSTASNDVTVLLDVPQISYLSAEPINATSIRINWNTTNISIVDSYTLVYTRTCDDVNSSLYIENTVTSIDIHDLASGLEYTLSIQPENILGKGIEMFVSVLLNETCPPGTPEIYPPVILNSTSIRVEWDEVECTRRNGIITGYIIQYNIINGSRPNKVTTNAEATSIVITGLSRFNLYSISIAAMNSIGTGLFSEMFVFFTFDNELTDLFVDAFTTSVQLSWEAISSNNSIMYTYEVAFNISSDRECSNADMNTLSNGYISYINTTETKIIITELESNTCYIFGVRIYSSYSTVPGDWNILVERTEELINERQATTSQSDDGIGLFATAGIAVTLLVMIVIITVIVITVVIVIIRMRSGKQHQYPSTEVEMDGNHLYVVIPSKKDDVLEQEQPEVETTYSSVNVCENVQKNDSIVYANASVVVSSKCEQLSKTSCFDPKIPPTLPISVENMGRHVAECHQQNNHGFKTQYEQIYNGSDKSVEIGFRNENKILNRFKNITVYDDNHITLMPIQGQANSHTDFINASYIDGYSMPKKFIATQGPLPNTIDDFWWLIWQERVQYIVMLTNIMEGTNTKCSHYWPDETLGSKTYGPFTVTVKEEQFLLNFIVRSLIVKLEGSADILAIKHFQFITWPDHGIPDSVSPFMTLCRRVTNWWNKQKGPIVVHCSAGVGRTGSYIAIDIALEQANKEGIVDIPGIINRLRQQRMKMVQMHAQFAFIHDAVLEVVVGGTTEITSDLFHVKVDNWRQKNQKTGKTPMQAQFQLLSQVTPDQRDIYKETAESFPENNRSTKFLPSEKWRVSLKGEYPNYIHASFINGYHTREGFIIAQSPMQNTTRDFFKMIVDYEVSAIVMCCDLQETGEETCFMYWNAQSPVCFGEFEIEMKNLFQEKGFVQRDFVIRNTKNNSCHCAIQFHIENWSDDGVIHHPHTILNVIENVIKVQRRSGEGPVVVHCSDTVSRPGIYCVVSNAIEQCKAEGVVDVFQATKAVRLHKPGAVTTLNQYDTIHEVILTYFAMHSTYSNFQFHN